MDLHLLIFMEGNHKKSFEMYVVSKRVIDGGYGEKEQEVKGFHRLERANCVERASKPSS